MESNDTLAQRLQKGAGMTLLRAIVEAGKEGVSDPEVVAALKELEKSKEDVWGFTVGDYATAALYLIEKKEYTGDNRNVKALVRSGFKL